MSNAVVVWDRHGTKWVKMTNASGLENGENGVVAGWYDEGHDLWVSTYELVASYGPVYRTKPVLPKKLTLEELL